MFCSHDAAPLDRVALAASMHDASETCVSFCDDLGTLNDLYLWLLYENSIAYSSLRTRGSTSPSICSLRYLQSAVLTASRLRELEENIRISSCIAVCEPASGDHRQRQHAILHGRATQTIVHLRLQQRQIICSFRRPTAQTKSTLLPSPDTSRSDRCSDDVGGG